MHRKNIPKSIVESTPSSSGHMLDLGRGSARTKEGIKVTGLEITTWVAASPESGLSESFMRNVQALHIYRRPDIRCLKRRQEEFNWSESDN